MKAAALRAAALVALVAVRGAHAEPPKPRESLAREIYQQLIEIDTTHATGSTTVAAQAVAERLRAAGVPAADIALLGPSARKGNLVARLHAAVPGGEKPLLLLAHLDVVDANPSDWTVDPFHLLERDGFFYARGTSDDKAMAAIFTTLFLARARSATPLRRDVVLALTADEEDGDEDGAQWLLAQHRELVDAGLVLNEGGGGQMRQGRYQINAVQAAEKTYADYEWVVRDPGGHSSRPTPSNAIYHLADALARLEKLTFPAELNDVTRSYLAAASKVETGDTAADMAALARDPGDAAAAARLSLQPSYNAVLRTTCVATRLEGGHANNALPQLARAIVNCRILPGHSADEVKEQLALVAEDPRVEIAQIDVASSAPSAAAELDPALLATVEGITQQMWPGVPTVPTMSSGATDSRYFRSAGIPAYGISGIFHDIDDIRAHGKDERLAVRSFYEGLDFLDRLVSALSETGPPAR